jgi:phenylalanyl-tRNA synthetase beta chain
MKFSYNWLRELVDGLQTPARELEQLITMKSAECEGIEPFGAPLAEAVAARIDSVEEIAGSHNRKARVHTGRYGDKTVICGAPNCRPGVVTAYVPIGKKTINGIESDGMLASGAELGVNREHEGILEIDIQVGGPLPGCVPDHIIDIDNKSITHRPDLWGHMGMAREVAAITGRKLLDPVRRDLVPGGAAAVKVAIEDLDLCPRYSALVFENVTVQPSPLWLQCRLTALGLNPINNIVDLTNYVMAEMAQPMHAFDRALLHGDTIYIRPARAGEKIVALNHEEYPLEPSNVVIADQGGPVAIAGVIGGLDSSITEHTTSIVFESANFHAPSVRRTSASLKLRTDASMRFEKAQDPHNTVRGLARAVELMRELSPGARLVGGLADQSRPLSPPPPIQLPLDWLTMKLGRGIDATEVREILERLEFGVSEPTPRVFSVSVPSWRATKDISMKDDLVEEVGRMVGYASIAPVPPLVENSPPPLNEERRFERGVRALLSASGYTEVYNYSFVNEEMLAAFGMGAEDHLQVANPISSEQGLMRASLVPGIWRNLVENSKHFDSFRIFEIGREIHKQAEGLPSEIPHLTAAIYARDDGAAGLFELKRVAGALMPGVEVRPATACPYEHPARAAALDWRGRQTGRLFELHPKMLETGRGAILDLNLDTIRGLSAETKRYTPIRRFPASAFDLSVIAGNRELAGVLKEKIAAHSGGLLESIEYLRQYSGPPLPEGMKSVSFRLTFAAPDRTLSSGEIAAVRDRIIEEMRRGGYELRV